LSREGFSQLDAKLSREVGDLREEMKRGFAETQAMIKFSYAELDRRVTVLETNVTLVVRARGAKGASALCPEPSRVSRWSGLGP